MWDKEGGVERVGWDLCKYLENFGFDWRVGVFDELEKVVYDNFGCESVVFDVDGDDFIYFVEVYYISKICRCFFCWFYDYIGVVN